MKPLDQCLLYGFVDSAYLDGRDPVELCRQLCDGGADLVQLRAKGWPILDIARLAKRLSPVTAGAGVRLVINDHPELIRIIDQLSPIEVNWSHTPTGVRSNDQR